jgi:hypothetical protein
MRKIVVIAILCLVMSSLTKAQDYVPSRDDINAFYNTKTLVVLLDNPLLEYNMVIREVMEQEWTITEFDFITFKEFEELRFDPQYSFLYMSQVMFDNDKTDARYRFLHLSLGGDYFRKKPDA